MRLASSLAGSALLLFALALTVALLYDAGGVTRLAGLTPADDEAGVVLVGLVVAAAALALGIGALRRAVTAA